MASTIQSSAAARVHLREDTPYITAKNLDPEPSAMVEVVDITGSQTAMLEPYRSHIFHLPLRLFFHPNGTVKNDGDTIVVSLLGRELTLTCSHPPMCGPDAPFRYMRSHQPPYIVAEEAAASCFADTLNQRIKRSIDDHFIPGVQLEEAKQAAKTPEVFQCKL